MNALRLATVISFTPISTAAPPLSAPIQIKNATSPAISNIAVSLHHGANVAANSWEANENVPKILGKSVFA